MNFYPTSLPCFITHNPLTYCPANYTAAREVNTNTVALSSLSAHTQPSNCNSTTTNEVKHVTMSLPNLSSAPFSSCSAEMNEAKTEISKVNIISSKGIAPESTPPSATPILARSLSLNNLNRLCFAKGFSSPMINIEQLRKRLMTLCNDQEAIKNTKITENSFEIAIEFPFTLKEFERKFPNFIQHCPQVMYANVLNKGTKGCDLNLCTFRVNDNTTWAQLTPQYQRQILNAIPSLSLFNEHFNAVLMSAIDENSSEREVWELKAAKTKLILYFAFCTHQDELLKTITSDKLYWLFETPLAPYYRSQMDILSLYLTQLSTEDFAYFNTRINFLNDYNSQPLYVKAITRLASCGCMGHGFRADSGGLANLTKVALEYSFSTLRVGDMAISDQACAGFHGPFFVILKSHTIPLFFMLPEARDKEVVQKVFDIAHQQGGLSLEESINLKSRLITTKELVSLSEEEIDAFIIACNKPMMQAWR